MNTLADFIGNEFLLDSYVANSGGGNVKAEYGMILYKIIGINGEKLNVARLKIRYGLNNKPHKMMIQRSWVDATKLVVVFPSPEILNIFEDVLSKEDKATKISNINQDLTMKLGSWIHKGTKFW